MKIFVFEFICGGGLGGQAAASELMPLGGAMLRCIIEDITALGVDVVTTLDRRVSLPLPAKTQIVTVSDANEFDAAFSTALLSADAAVVIAPEFHGLLESFSKRVVHAGKRLIGCDPRGVAQCSDKFALATRLRRACIATPRTLAGIPTGEELADMLPMVVKPRFGAGCEDTFVIHHESEIAELPARDDWIAQPLIPGTAASAAFIVKHDGSVLPLRAGLQKIARGSDETTPSGARRLAYSGGVLPVPPQIEARLFALGAGALAGVRGLRGFVGVDLLIGNPGGAARDCVIEINPRLTVAYVGLRALSQDNLAAWLLDAAGLRGPWSMTKTPGWRAGQIDYTGGGQATWSPTGKARWPRITAENPA
jgi:predicted ATP-grasp superfamily ATP-dependent carboligase